MKILDLLFIILILFSFTNCGNDLPEVPEKPKKEEIVYPIKPENKEEKDVYYVKYSAKSTRTYGPLGNIILKPESGVDQTIDSVKYSFEQTYGPVSKGFKAKMTVKGTATSMEISICKNNEPFAVKATKSGNYAYRNASIEYTIK